MQINLISVGNKMPGWVNTGYHEYAKRLQKYCKLNLIEIPLTSRGKNTNPVESKRAESKLILDKINKQDFVIALDITAKQYDTLELANYLDKLSLTTSNITIVIGGPDGLADDCLKRANDKISLSKLTLPHPIVRIILAEQLYRAYSILDNHPYHK